jgi:Protein of unknown function (DUF1553)/Protein of unknown function (DUF1549)
MSTSDITGVRAFVRRRGIRRLRIKSVLLLAVIAAAIGLAVDRSGGLLPRARAKESNHWSYQPVVRPELPAVRQKSWIRSPIDAFILAKLESGGIMPSPDASRATLIRRAYLDVWGLLPSPEEVRAFVSDESPNAYEKVVERLLASTHYGERWGRHWLDLTRYADSDGYNQDATRPNIWRYRDYVISSFNDDKPYARFIREQLAGDEIWPGDLDAFAATGFLRNYPDEINARDLYLRRQEILDDLTGTVGSVFLATTVSCANCHDHKFDPLPQKDYYRLQAFFANTSARDDIPALKGDELAVYQKRLAIWQEKTKEIRSRIDALLKPLIDKHAEERLHGYTPETRASLIKPASERTPYDRWIYHRSRWTFANATQRAVRELKEQDKGRYEEYEKLQAQLKGFADLYPGDLPMISGMTELGSDAPPTHLLDTGSYFKPKTEVQPGFLPFLTAADPIIKRTAETSGRRTALADWIASPKNPLTARVIVNRIWSYYFGRGIVDSVSDFGRMGERPTHPELLDWLADELVRNGWSLKTIQRDILLSNTYRQASAYREDAAKLDAVNSLLWRFPRKRLEAEALRDSSLQVAGLLEEKFGGPGVFPPLPSGLDVGRAWRVTDDAGEHNRRSVYIFVRRNLPYPLLEVFDLASTQAPCPRREISTTAPQGLTLFNSELVYGWSRALADRLLHEAGTDPAKQVERLFYLLYSRPPDAEEKSLAQSFLARQREVIAKRIESGKPVSEPLAYKAHSIKSLRIDRAEAAALADLCHALLNSNEFVYRF